MVITLVCGTRVVGSNPTASDQKTVDNTIKEGYKEYNKANKAGSGTARSLKCVSEKNATFETVRV